MKYHVFANFMDMALILKYEKSSLLYLFACLNEKYHDFD